MRNYLVTCTDQFGNVLWTCHMTEDEYKQYQRARQQAPLDQPYIASLPAGLVTVIKKREQQQGATTTDLEARMFDEYQAAGGWGGIGRGRNTKKTGGPTT